MRNTDRSSSDALSVTNRARDYTRVRALLLRRPNLTARQVSRRLRMPLVTTRARISDGCRRNQFRKVRRVDERDSACRVWCFRAWGGK